VLAEGDCGVEITGLGERLLIEREGERVTGLVVCVDSSRSILLRFDLCVCASFR
jgi:hypothetical protein